jgi:hypothetical protein
VLFDLRGGPAGKSSYVVYGHDKATCSHSGGNMWMEGRSREECINHQRRINTNDTHFVSLRRRINLRRVVVKAELARRKQPAQTTKRRGM